jgi:hypothetical protein
MASWTPAAPKRERKLRRPRLRRWRLRDLSALARLRADGATLVRPALEDNNATKVKATKAALVPKTGVLRIKAELGGVNLRHVAPGRHRLSGAPISTCGAIDAAAFDMRCPGTRIWIE